MKIKIKYRLLCIAAVFQLFFAAIRYRNIHDYDSVASSIGERLDKYI